MTLILSLFIKIFSCLKQDGPDKMAITKQQCTVLMSVVACSIYILVAFQFNAVPEWIREPYACKGYKSMLCQFRTARSSAWSDAGRKPHPPQPLEVCTPTTSLVFVKTHKTGGSTLARVINRYGYSRNLSFMLYKKDGRLGHFRQSSLTSAKDLLPPIGVNSSEYDDYRNYDIMTSHILLLPNLDFIKQYMNPKAKFITVLREPTKQWESAFFFFGCGRSMKVPGRNSSERVTNFLAKPLSYWGKARPNQCTYYSRNGMWFDLASNSSIHEDVALISSTLRILDDVLDLVLITEYLDESLLLLKKEMCWDFVDILYIKANQRNTDSVLTDELRLVARKWNTPDVLLYDHFNKTLWRKVAAYGNKFAEDLQYFRNMLDTHHHDCGLEENVSKRNIVKVSSRNNSTLCQGLVKMDTKDIIHRQT